MLTARTASAAAVVTVRELSRETKGIIERLKERGQALLVTSGGEPVALLVPIDRGLRHAMRPFREEDGEPDGTRPAAEEDEALAGLNDLQRRVLDALRNGPRTVEGLVRTVGCETGELGLALAGLEIRGFARRTFAGFDLA